MFQNMVNDIIKVTNTSGSVTLLGNIPTNSVSADTSTLSHPVTDGTQGLAMATVVSNSYAPGTYLIATVDMQFSGTCAEVPTCFGRAVTSATVPTTVANSNNTVPLSCEAVALSTDRIIITLKERFLVEVPERVAGEAFYVGVCIAGLGTHSGVIQGTLRIHSHDLPFHQPLK